MSEPLTLSAEVQDAFKAKDAQLQEVLLRLGRLEVDYTAEKQRLLVEAQELAKARLDIVVEAGTAAGLDMSQPWRLDLSVMALVQQ